MKRREIVAKMDEIVAFSGVEKFIDTPIKKYSSGMKLRLGFAVAAHLDPDVLFVDEVLAVGDADFQKKCLNAMNDLRQGGRTVVFVSHNMAAVENLCPRAIWIEGGEVQRDGESIDVIRAYLSMFAGSRQTGYDLSGIQSRGGNGLIQYTGIDFVDEVGRPCPLLRSGDRVCVRLHFRAREEVQHPHFGFKLFSDLGTLITTISTWATGLEIAAIPPGAGQIDLELDSVNLMPGRYYVSLSLSSVGGVRYDILDHCIAIDIEPADPYGTGKGIEARFGLVYLTGRFKYRSR